MDETLSDPLRSDETTNEIDIRNDSEKEDSCEDDAESREPRVRFQIELLRLKEDLPDKTALKGQIVPMAVRARSKKVEADSKYISLGLEITGRKSEWRCVCRETLDRIKFFDISELVELPEAEKSLRNYWKAERDAVWCSAELIIDGLEERSCFGSSAQFRKVRRDKNVMVFLVAAVQHDWHLRKINVSSVTFYEQFNEEVYTDQPDGFDDLTGRKFRFNCFFHEHEKGSLGWVRAFTQKVQTIKFNPLSSYNCVFKRTEGKKEAFLIIDGYEVLLGCEDVELLEQCVNDFETLFALNGSSRLPTEFSSMYIERTKDGMTLDSRNAIHTLLKHFNKVTSHFKCDKSKITSTLTPYPDLIASPRCSDLYSYLDKHKTFKYRRGTESLVRIAKKTRPDILLEALRLTKFRGLPIKKNWIKLVKLINYLSLSPTVGLVLKKTASPTLIAYQDTSITASNLSPRIAVCLFLGSNPLFWSCKSAPRDPEKVLESKSKNPIYCNSPANIIGSFISLLDQLSLIDRDEEGVLYTCSRTAEPSPPVYKSNMRFNEINQEKARINEVRMNQMISLTKTSCKNEIQQKHAVSTINSLLYLMSIEASVFGHETIQLVDAKEVEEEI